MATLDAISSGGSVGTPNTEITATLELAPGGSYERRKPFFVDDEQAARSTQEVVKECFGNLKQAYRNIRMVTLPDALVTGQGAVITNGGHLVRESVLEFTAQGRTPDGLQAGEAGEYKMPARVDRVIEAPCLLLKRPWYANFGHWLVDGASVLALSAAPVKAQNLKLVIANFPSRKMRDVVLSTIERLAPDVTVLEHSDSDIWQFKTLYYVSPPHVPPLFKLPAGLQGIRAGLLGGEPMVVPSRRLFITRRNADNRNLANEDEIFSVCAQRGFELIDTAKYAISEQAALFAQAEAVIGAKGAALTNCMFCAPETKVMVLSPADFPDPFFWDIAAQLNCDYGELFGPILTDKARSLNDFTVEPARVTAMLNAAGL